MYNIFKMKICLNEKVVLYIQYHQYDNNLKNEMEIQILNDEYEF